MENDKIFQTYCEKSLEILNAKFDATKVITHNSTSGQIREGILKNFLIDHIPDVVHIVSGQIIDSYNNYSKQQDAVITFKRSPRLPFISNNDLIFVEGVVGTIEVKSQLDYRILKDIGLNINSVNKLRLNSGGISVNVPGHRWRFNKRLTCIVTYRGSDLFYIKEKLQDLSDSQTADLILDLNRGLLVKNHGMLLKKEESNNENYIVISDPSIGFKMFLTFLIEITSTNATRSVRWRSYW